MYNILLTDDEQIVIDSIKFIIDKNFSEEVNIFTALSGSDAINIASSNQLDLIFMDINMPGLNGLDAIKCIRQLNQETKIVVLTAFDSFLYAQEALNIGAFKYITKPVNKNTIIGIIREVMSLVDEQRGQKIQSQDLEKKLDSVLPMIESDFIYSCVFQQDSQSDFSYYFDYFGITQDQWIFITLEFLSLDEKEKNKIYPKIRQIINQTHKTIISPFIMNRIVIFYPVLEEEKDDDYLSQNITELYNKIINSVGKNIKFGVSSKENDCAKMNNSYNNSLRAIERLSDEKGICFYSKITAQEEDFSDLCKTLCSKIILGDITFTNSFFETVFNSLSTKNINELKNKLMELLFNIKQIVLELNPKYSSPDFDSLFTFFSNEDSLEKIKQFCSNLIYECTQEIKNIKSLKENPIISKVTEYVLQNLSLDLSLEKVSSVVNVSSFYLSRLFKEEKGIAYSVFINDKRLTKAKQLLEESNLSIKEISAACGYSDQNYFSRLFKNNFGISPTSLREVL